MEIKWPFSFSENSCNIILINFCYLPSQYKASHLRNVILRLTIVLDVINRKTHWLNITESRNRIYVQRGNWERASHQTVAIMHALRCNLTAIQRGLCILRIKCSKWKVNCRIKRDKHFIGLFVTGNVSKLLFRDKNYEYIDSDVRITRRTIIHP
jgi:uncharacterized membrane protein YciS (DUF1049 family)